MREGEGRRERERERERAIDIYIYIYIWRRPRFLPTFWLFARKNSMF